MFILLTQTVQTSTNANVNKGRYVKLISCPLQVDPMFTVPAPPGPGQPGAPGSSLPSAPSYSPPALHTSNHTHLAVRTRSIGTNTQDGGDPGALEGESTYLGPCQPGTSVNLEGIVWHETEEGKTPDMLLVR